MSAFGYYANRFEDNVHELEVRIAVPMAEPRARGMRQSRSWMAWWSRAYLRHHRAPDGGTEQRRQTAILEATTDLVAYWNQAGQIAYMNAGGRRMLGIARSRSRQREVKVVLTPGGWGPCARGDRTGAAERYLGG